MLDLACGTGNAALIAAGRGARAVGIDSERTLLEIAEDRASALGLSVEFVCADLASPQAEAFSVILSAFGVMYAQDHDAAAAALARAAAPRARIALAAWTPGSFLPAMGSVLAPYLPPPPPASGPPSRWGEEAAVAELLARHAITVLETRRASLALCFSDRSAAVQFLIRTAGHVVSERSRLDQEGRWKQLVTDLGALVAERDDAGVDGVHGVELRCEYLLALAAPDGSKRGPACGAGAHRPSDRVGAVRDPRRRQFRTSC